MQIFQKKSFVDEILEKIKAYQNLILLGIGIVVLGVGGVYGYMYHKKSREERAYRALTLALEYFDAPIQAEQTEDFVVGKKDFRTHQEKWEKVESVFKQDAELHKKSGIAALFLVYQSEALAELKKVPEAIATLRSAIAKMQNESIKDYYQVKLALMLLDTSDEGQVKEGLEILAQKANKESAISHDMALYYLGLYYWHEKKFEEARNYWNQLVLKYGKQERYASPWVVVAKEKLSLIDSDVE